jgi:hypothetical protein
MAQKPDLVGLVGAGGFEGERRGIAPFSYSVAKSRNGIKAMLTGSVSSLGGGEYVISLDAVSAATGHSLGQEQAQASRKEDVLNALGNVTSAMRQKLGESLASVRNLTSRWRKRQRLRWKH